MKREEAGEYITHNLLKMEALGRVELPTNGLGNRCSIHLSYRATRRNRLGHFSLLQQTLGGGRILLPNCCPIAE